MSKIQLHTTHPEIVKRLRRAEGHMRTVIAMIEQQRGCLDIAQQLHAIEKAVASAKKALIHDHIDHCLEHTNRAGRDAAKSSITEFKQISKYL
jgi:uncharacterized protein